MVTLFLSLIINKVEYTKIIIKYNEKYLQSKAALHININTN